MANRERLELAECVAQSGIAGIQEILAYPDRLDPPESWANPDLVHIVKTVEIASRPVRHSLPLCRRRST